MVKIISSTKESPSQIDGEDQSIKRRLRFYKGAFESIKQNPI